jgi:translation initiation factor IF-2
MNVTELARILKITPQELRDYLPGLGFDIGQKAIKINRNVANKIIRDWPFLKKKIEKQKQLAAQEEKEEQDEIKTKKTIKIPKFITVRELSQISGLPVNIILSELMKNGIFTSLNERVDFETAWLIGSELGLEVKLKKSLQKEEMVEEDKLKTILAKEKKGNLQIRPPVIVVMGHVDHGKTKLLDAIRRTNVAEEEAGGITQHIGAYQVIRHNKLITFIDTPGHEAFTAMRNRGAKIADIAILVVAADDGVKPQTIEAFRIIAAAKIPFVVAINKIDKGEANIEKTKQELSNQLKIMPEDWGGKTICVPISAKKEMGIEELLDMVLLTAEAEADNIMANPNTNAIGTVIESHIDKGTGPVATILIQNGTLNIGDQLALNHFIIGKVRGLNNYRGEKIKKAEPATPVQIIGLKNLPQVGDVLTMGGREKVKLKKLKITSRPPAPVQEETTSEDDQEIKKINLIIKSDVLGSAEAIEESLEKINTTEVKVKIVHKGLGNITDGDIKRAEAANAQIIGFNVKTPPVIKDLAREKNIRITLYHIIYDLINDIKEQMQQILEPTIKKIELGKLKVIAIFKTDKGGQIVGGKVMEGKIETNSFIEVIRETEIISKGKLTRLQSGKQDVNSAEVGQQCGVQYEGKPIIQKGDTLLIYKEEKIISKI